MKNMGRPMPELPELEILAAELNERAVGREFKSFTVNRDRNPGFPMDTFRRTVVDAQIKNVSRKGKMLLIELSNENCLLVHLMMEGQVILTDRTDYNEKITELVFHFKDGWNLWVSGVALKYVRFGTRLEIENLPVLKKLGLNPLDNRFTLELFRAGLARKRGAVKPALMDQAFIAGIGNTYVDELLFAAGVRPDTPVGELSPVGVARIYESIIATLKLGIAAGGASDFGFVHLDGSKGSFQDHFKVNRRKGKPCPRCNAVIAKMTVGGRGTYYCPGCQK
jgi:formamidopyrimidine-DNA glycosylase